MYVEQTNNITSLFVLVKDFQVESIQRRNLTLRLSPKCSNTNLLFPVPYRTVPYMFNVQSYGFIMDNFNLLDYCIL
jgi:hypothetical protein